MKDLEIKLEIYEKMIRYHTQAGHTSSVESFEAEVKKIKEQISQREENSRPAVIKKPARKTSK